MKFAESGMFLTSIVPVLCTASCGLLANENFGMGKNLDELFYCRPYFRMLGQRPWLDYSENIQGRRSEIDRNGESPWQTFSDLDRRA